MRTLRPASPGRRFGTNEAHQPLRRGALVVDVDQRDVRVGVRRVGVQERGVVAAQLARGSRPWSAVRTAMVARRAAGGTRPGVRRRGPATQPSHAGRVTPVLVPVRMNANPERANRTARNPERRSPRPNPP